MNEEKPSIVARCLKCKALVLAIVDEPGNVTRKDKNQLGRLAASGFSIEHITVGEVRKADFGCKCKNGKKRN